MNQDCVLILYKRNKLLTHTRMEISEFLVDVTDFVYLHFDWFSALSLRLFMIKLSNGQNNAVTPIVSLSAGIIHHLKMQYSIYYSKLAIRLFGAWGAGYTIVIPQRLSKHLPRTAS